MIQGPRGGAAVGETEEMEKNTVNGRCVLFFCLSPKQISRFGLSISYIPEK